MIHNDGINYWSLCYLRNFKNYIVKVMQCFLFPQLYSHAVEIVCLQRFICIVGRLSDRERENDNLGVERVIYVLAHSAHCCTRQNWARNTVWISHVGGGIPSAWVIVHSFSGALARSWIRRRAGKNWTSPNGSLWWPKWHLTHIDSIVVWVIYHQSINKCHRYLRNL